MTPTAPFHRLSLADVLAMVKAGILMQTDRVELEDGVLLDMEPSGGCTTAASTA